MGNIIVGVEFSTKILLYQIFFTTAPIYWNTISVLNVNKMKTKMRKKVGFNFVNALSTILNKSNSTLSTECNAPFFQAMVKILLDVDFYFFLINSMLKRKML